MKISIKSTNIELTEAISSYAIQKIETLNKLTSRFDAPSNEILCDIEVEKITNHQSAM